MNFPFELQKSQVPKKVQSPILFFDEIFTQELIKILQKRWGFTSTVLGP